MKKIGLRHRFCQDVRCKQCLKDHEDFGRYLDEKTGRNDLDHLGKFRMWIENQVSYEVETEWGWSHPDTLTQEYADAIGADGYAPDAILAVDKAKELLGHEQL